MVFFFKKKICQWFLIQRVTMNPFLLLQTKLWFSILPRASGLPGRSPGNHPVQPFPCRDFIVKIWFHCLWTHWPSMVSSRSQPLLQHSSVYTTDRLIMVEPIHVTLKAFSISRRQWLLAHMASDSGQETEDLNTYGLPRFSRE